MRELGQWGHGSDIQRGGVGIVSGRRVFGPSTGQVHASRAGSPDFPASKVGGATTSERKRKKRIAKYKVYTVEGKVKASLRRGIRWIKNKCSLLLPRR